MHQVRIVRPTRRRGRRTELAPLAAPKSAGTDETDDLLERIGQVLGMS